MDSGVTLNQPSSSITTPSENREKKRNLFLKYLFICAGKLYTVAQR